MRACVWCHLESIVRSDIQKAESLSHHYDLSIEILPLERNKCLKEGCFQKKPSAQNPMEFRWSDFLRPKPPLTPARQNDVASVSPEPTVKSAKIFNAKKIVLVLSDASGYDLSHQRDEFSNSWRCLTVVWILLDIFGAFDSRHQYIYISIYTVYICTVYMVYMCVYDMYVYVYLYASKVKTTIPCHIMHFWTKDEQLLDCSLVFWHSRGPLKVGCQGPPMAFEFNFWGSRYARRSRFKLPHRLHGVLGFPVKPVATLKVELFHPAFLQGLPNEKGGKFWWDFLEIWCCRSEWNASWLARHLAGHIQREA